MNQFYAKPRSAQQHYAGNEGQPQIIPFTTMFGGGVEATPISFRYVIRINDVIGEPYEWTQEVSAIQNATANDIIHIYINSPGGSLYTTTEILSAMLQTEAHVITEITGECSSAATLIFLAGHEYRVSDDASWMSHQASYGMSGKEHEIYDSVVHSRKVLQRLMNKYYKDFLTEEEMQQMFEGKDFYFDADQIMERLNKRAEIFQKELGIELVENPVFEDVEEEQEELDQEPPEDKAFEESEVDLEHLLETTCQIKTIKSLGSVCAENFQLHSDGLVLTDIFDGDLSLEDSIDDWIEEYGIERQEWVTVGKKCLNLSFNPKDNTSSIVKKIYKEFKQLWINNFSSK